jgi:alkylresorcinol/alkylpyrone synthase
MSFPRFASVARTLPAHSATQKVLSDALRGYWKIDRVSEARLDSLHQSVRVERRYQALPIEAYPPLDTFTKRNAAWIEQALVLGQQAAEKALQQAKLSAADVDILFFNTITGLATPSIDARLVHRMGFRDNVKRVPMFGLGCVAGAAGTARVADMLKGSPSSTALFLTVELCSLTIQREDTSVANLIAAGLFGDGAAAFVMRGSQFESEGPSIVASESVLYPNSEEVMGWEFRESGFKVVLSASVPAMVTTHIRKNVDAFLKSHGLQRDNVKHWVAHTGGPKVLEAFEQSLELPAGALHRSWNSLRDVGNLSSASVLFVLSQLLEEGTAQPGDIGVMLAMGPGFCAEMVLLKW